MAVRIKGPRLDVVRVEEPVPVEQCGAHRLQLVLCLRCGVLNRGIPSFRAIWRVLRSVVRPREAVRDVVVGWMTTICPQAMFRCCSPRKPCLLALLDCPLHATFWSAIACTVSCARRARAVFTLLRSCSARSRASTRRRMPRSTSASKRVSASASPSPAHRLVRRRSLRLRCASASGLRCLLLYLRNAFFHSTDRSCRCCFCITSDASRSTTGNVSSFGRRRHSYHTSRARSPFA